MEMTFGVEKSGQCENLPEKLHSTDDNYSSDRFDYFPSFIDTYSFRFHRHIS